MIPKETEQHENDKKDSVDSSGMHEYEDQDDEECTGDTQRSVRLDWIERFEDWLPQQYSSKIQKRQRVIHALKVGFGVILSSLLVLIDTLNELCQGNGVWAVITVVIVTLSTPGETTQKMINRTVGTLVAALLALSTGVIGVRLSDVMHPVGHVFVGISNFAVGIVGTLLYWRGGEWAYACLLGTVTYTFLSVSVLEDDDISVAIIRTIMISLGGVIGLIISWLPPRVRSSDVARAYLADSFLDTAICAELVVHNFLTGAQELNPIQDIYNSEDSTDDTFHSLSKMVQVNRVRLEAAISASKFEGTGPDIQRLFRNAGLVVRLALRTLLSADMLLRSKYRTLDPSIMEEEELAFALRCVVSAIRSQLVQNVIDLNCSIPQEFESTTTSDMSKLENSLHELECSLQQYIKLCNAKKSRTLEKKKKKKTAVTGEAMMTSFGCHVAFAKLIYDTGNYLLQVAPIMAPEETKKRSQHAKELVL